MKRKNIFHLNNKGFAITSIIYSMLILTLVLMTLTIATLARRKMMLDKVRKETLRLVEPDVNNLTAFDVLYSHEDYPEIENVKQALDELYRIYLPDEETEEEEEVS